MKLLYFLFILAACKSTVPVTPEPSPPIVPSTPQDPPIKIITDLAAQSSCRHFDFDDRGTGPIGYFKGMSLVFARQLCQLKTANAPQVIMARANTGNDKKDALSWFNSNFKAKNMKNDKDGVETLRHLLTLQIALGMQESSGEYCEGRDMAASNTGSNNAEAGLFQTSYDASPASPELPKLLAKYKASKDGCYLDIFKEGVPASQCTAKKATNYGSGDGQAFQLLAKTCPTFAAEFAAVTLRTVRDHYYPINKKTAEIVPACDQMLLNVQVYVESAPEICEALMKPVL